MMLSELLATGGLLLFFFEGTSVRTVGMPERFTDPGPNAGLLPKQLKASSLRLSSLGEL